MLPLAAHPLAHCSTTRIRSRVGFGLRSKFAEAEIRAAEAGFDEQAIRQGGRPRGLRDAQRAPEDADRFRRHARGIDTGRT